MLQEFVANVPALFSRTAVADASIVKLRRGIVALSFAVRRRRGRRGTSAQFVDAMRQEFLRRSLAIVLRSACGRTIMEQLLGVFLALGLAIWRRRLVTILRDAVRQYGVGCGSTFVLSAALINAMMVRFSRLLLALLLAICRGRRKVAMIL